jgi:hypothetical protein
MQIVLVMGIGRYGTPAAFKRYSPGVRGRSRKAETLGPNSRCGTVPSK